MASQGEPGKDGLDGLPGADGEKVISDTNRLLFYQYLKHFVHNVIFIKPKSDE